MLKFLAVFLLAINPLVSLLADKINQSQDASQKETPLANDSTAYQLPLQEDAFIVSGFLLAYPERNWNIRDPELTSKIAFVYDSSKNKNLFKKGDIFESRPIASLTKLMTALVVLENADLNDIFFVTKKAVATNGEMGNLRVGEKISVKSLLSALLIESSNDAAIAMAENIGDKILNEQKNSDNEFSEDSINTFVELMNKSAIQMKLKNTSFFDPSGLDQQNRSCAWDITQMLKEVLSRPVLREIMQTQSVDIFSSDGRYNHHLTNSNKLLVLPDVIGGKTGFTEEAGNCMTLAAKTPNNHEMLLIVVMGAENRIAETKALLEWTKMAYLW